MKNIFLLFSLMIIVLFSCKKEKTEPLPIPNSANAFITFSLPGQISSVISPGAHTVTILMPFGVKLDTLVAATFTFSENATVKIANVNQTSGVTLNNFNTPVTYTITAENGTAIQDWVVTADYETYSYLSVDFPTGGNTYLMNVDTMGFSSYSLGTAGKGRIWSFTGLGIDIVDTIRYSIANQHPSYSHYPGSSFVYWESNQAFDMFGKISTQQAEFSGVHAEYGSMVFDLPMDNNSIQMQFPAEIGSSYSDHGSVSKDTLTTIPGIPIPVTVTIQVDIDITSSIDANGFVTTPLGSFKCIRQYKEQITNIQVLAMGNPIPGYGGADTLRTYSFINKDKAAPVLIVEVDATGKITKIKHQK